MIYVSTGGASLLRSRTRCQSGVALYIITCDAGRCGSSPFTPRAIALQSTCKLGRNAVDVGIYM